MFDLALWVDGNVDVDSPEELLTALLLIILMFDMLLFIVMFAGGKVVVFEILEETKPDALLATLPLEELMIEM